jgi:hypothetical protein
VAIDELVATAELLLTTGDSRYRQRLDALLPQHWPVQFAPRAHQPLLMLNGRYDFDQSSEMQAKPMFRLWGAPEKDKRLVIFESGHIPGDLRDIIREILDWLDKYLGPVKTTG